MADMTLKRITLQLARNPGLPGGDPEQGYVLIAPLNAAGLIDPVGWRENRKACRVFRFHPDPDQRADGWLTHRGNNWYIHYDEDDEGDDEPIYRLGAHILKEGAYVTVGRSDGDSLTFKVTDIAQV